MRIWVVQGSCWEDHWVEGVFDTDEQAEKIKAQLEAKSKRRRRNDNNFYVSVFILNQELK